MNGMIEIAEQNGIESREELINKCYDMEIPITGNEDSQTLELYLSSASDEDFDDEFEDDDFEDEEEFEDDFEDDKPAEEEEGFYEEDFDFDEEEDIEDDDFMDEDLR